LKDAFNEADPHSFKVDTFFAAKIQKPMETLIRQASERVGDALKYLNTTIGQHGAVHPSDHGDNIRLHYAAEISRKSPTLLFNNDVIRDSRNISIGSENIPESITQVQHDVQIDKNISMLTHFFSQLQSDIYEKALQILDKLEDSDEETYQKVSQMYQKDKLIIENILHIFNFDGVSLARDHIYSGLGFYISGDISNVSYSLNSRIISVNQCITIVNDYLNEDHKIKNKLSLPIVVNSKNSFTLEP
jgi:hypothetical protein